MSSITTRSGKGSPLTNSEVDANFTNLNTDKLENITSESIKSLSDVYSLMSPSDGQALVFDSTNGWQAENVTTDTSALMPKSGGTFTGDVTFTGDSYSAFWDKSESHLHFNDRATLSFGGSSSAPDMVFEHHNALNLNRIRGSNITIQDADGTNIAVFKEDAGAALYFNGSQKAEVVIGGFDVTGNITVSGTVDGRDVATDGTKLDGIEANATADQTKADIDALNINADLLDGQHGSYYTGYTDTAISNLVDSSPSALNTLNELAAALDDDANFSATVTTSLGTKLPKSGGTMTGNINLNTQSLTFSDSLNQYSISSASSSALKIQAGAASGQQIDVLSNTIRLQNQAGTKTGLQSTPEGATTLYHNNAAKIETSSSGVTVTGTLAATALTGDGSGLTNLPAQSFDVVDDTSPQLGGDLESNSFDIKLASNDRLYLGDLNHSSIYSNGTSLNLYSGGSTRITGSNITFATQGGGEEYASFNANGSVDLYHNNIKKFETTSTGVTVTGTLAATAITGDGSGLTNLPAQSFDVVDDTSPQLGGHLSTNNYNIYYSDGTSAYFGAGNDLQITHDGSNSYISENGTGVLKIQAANLEMLHADGSRGIRVTDDGGPVLYYDGSSKITVTSGGATVSGNIIVTGTVDGRDVATDGTKLDGIAAGANVGIPTTGGTFTGDVTFGSGPYYAKWDDSEYAFIIDKNAKLAVGDGGSSVYDQNFMIYANSVNNTYINNQVGSLNISNQGDGDVTLEAENASGAGGRKYWRADVSLSEMQLFYDNSQKLATKSTGVEVTGTLAATSLTGNGDGITVSSSALSGTSPSVDVSAKDTYTLTTSGNTTFSFTGAPSSGDVGTFSLILTAGGTHTITWPSSVDWAGGSAPDAPASGEKNIYTFMTVDGGSNYYGFLAGAAFA